MQGAKRGDGQNRNDRKQLFGRGALSGEVVSVDDKSFTVKLNDGSSSTVILSENTSYRISKEANKSDVSAGSKIAIFGTPSSDGSTVATSIEINPLMRGRNILSN